MRGRVLPYIAVLGLVGLSGLIVVVFVADGPGQGLQYVLLVTTVVFALLAPSMLRWLIGTRRRKDHKTRATAKGA
jgi:hypothetical protein